MKKAICIGIIIILVIVAALAAIKAFTKERGNIETDDFGVLLPSIIILAVIMIFGGIVCF